jgi:acyl-[acyl-carrier-protein]-phospholipid O-acyltransferase/long-chain-fatty-acid--[acyl-carrier-protein] ligase
MQQKPSLFNDKRFLPLFIVQFCGCLNDCILKSALIIWVIYKIAADRADLLILFINGIFVLPFVIFAGIAGQVSDKYEKSFLVKIIKLSEIFIVLLGVAGFYYSSLAMLITSVTLMGIHSTFFGTLKFSIIPEHLKKDELLTANGYIESATFIGVLMGTLIGGLYNWQPVLISALMVAISCIGYAASLFVPHSPSYATKIKINPNIFIEGWNILKYSYSKQIIFLAILGISWFWFIGASILSQLPTLTKDTFGADEGVANMFLATFSIGVGVGSLWCSKLLNGQVTTKYVFNAAIGMAILGVDLFFAAKNSAISIEPEERKSILVFLSKAHNWRILLDFFLFSVLGGLYIIPLYALMQSFSSANYRSRLVAANNLMNSLFMIVSALFVSILLTLGCSVPFIILIISLLNFMAAGYIYMFLPEVNILPRVLIKKIFRFLFNKIYDVEIIGIENFYDAGKRVVIISNHISFLDAALLAVYVQDNPTFAINSTVAKEWWMRPLLQLVKAYPVDTNNPMAIKNLIKELKRNKKIAIFPEGRVSTTGRLMKMYAGPVMIAAKGRATILPMTICGPEYTIFSRIPALPIKRFRHKIRITFLKAIDIAEQLKGVDHKNRLKIMSQKLYDLMTVSLCNSSQKEHTIFNKVLAAAKIYGNNYPIIHDSDNNKLTYRALITKSFVLGGALAKDVQAGGCVGLMLPNAAVTCVAFLAIHTKFLVPAMINFTQGSASIISSCKTAQVKYIYTAKKFIQKAGLDDLLQDLSKEFEVIFLEDVASKITVYDKIKGFMLSFLPNLGYDQEIARVISQKPAIVLFTSGTESSPKAVVLSHENILSNITQILSVLDFNHNDRMFNSLPMFHCFGLVASIMSVSEGIKMTLYPSPLHYKIIPEAIYGSGATIMFSTDTFLNGYAKYAHPYDFHSLRYVFAGAEKLKSHTKELWSEKFGIRILEGYGATETSPVLSANARINYKLNTVGKILPNIEYDLLPLEGIDEGGILAVKGPNVMLGYMLPDAPGVIQEPFVESLGRGWYDTGDVVSIDEAGYIKILGRVKRFAKVAGEIVSLLLLEEVAALADPKGMHAAVHVQDAKKGEQIVLFTTSNSLTKESIMLQIRRAKISELYMPKIIIQIEDLPVLATGKINYRKISTLVQMSDVI